MIDLLGKTIGQYQLVELISQSEKNLVFKGFQPAMNRYAAVKVLAPQQVWEQDVVQQFQQEVQLLVGLQHKNILPVYDYGQDQGVYFVATEYAAGATLKERLPQFYSLQRAQQMVNGIAQALDYVHSKGVVHGNLKSSNILINQGDQPLLTDFGAFQNMGELGQGNPYQSPEQARGGVVDRHTDVYALGVLLFEMVTDQIPPIGVLPNPRQVRPDLPVAVEQIILKAMAQYPEQRFQSAGELSKALSSALGTTTPAAAPVPTPAPKPAPVQQAGPNRMPWLIGGVVVLLLALLACLAALFFLDFGDSDSGGNIIVVVPTPAPAVPSVRAARNTDIRSGPGAVYDKIGLLQGGQSAEAVGRSNDGQWWVIKVDAAASGQGWIVGGDVQTQNVDNLPVIDSPPTPTPPIIEPGPPQAVINGTTQAVVGQVANFTARNSGVGEGSHLVTFAWNFDDGSEAAGVDVSHAYNNPGTYTVELTITDDKGLSDTTTHKIQIDSAPNTPEPDEPPVAVINGPAQAETGQSATFDANQSQCAGQCVSYAWDMGDGSTYNATVINHTYNASGSYNVVLVVTDDNGLQGQVNHQIDVEAGEPEPGPGEDLEGRNWSLDGVLPGTEITAFFENGIISGSGGCNNYRGTYTVGANNGLVIQLEPVSGAECDADVTEQETTYLTNLSSVTGYETRRNNLTLFGAGTLTYTEK